MTNTTSVATENFIKTIYHMEQGEGMDPKPGRIAQKLGISHAAATDMARKLAQKELIDYQKYKELKLTASGRKLALNVIRKHRLWETFLHQIFDLSMHEIHREAENLEHFTSDFLAEKIESFLGNPTSDPHGDPIPNAQGVVEIDGEIQILAQATSDQEYEVSRLSGSDKEFFDFCHSNHLRVGEKIRLIKQLVKNRMTEIEVQDTRLLINEDFTSRIYVKNA